MTYDSLISRDEAPGTRETHEEIRITETEETIVVQDDDEEDSPVQDDDDEAKDPDGSAESGFVGEE